MKIAQRLRDVLSYDPETGHLTWRVPTNRRITVDDRHLGTFPSADLAHAAYIAAKRIAHEGNTL